MLFVSLFGATSSYDAFIIASHIPSFITYVITEAGLTQIFTPLLSEKQMLSGNQKTLTWRVDHLAFILTAAGVVYFLMLYALGFSFRFIFTAQHFNRHSPPTNPSDHPSPESSQPSAPHHMSEPMHKSSLELQNPPAQNQLNQTM